MSGWRLRFTRRIRIVPGITLNLTRRGVSTSVGPRGFRTTFGRRGVRQTIGLPGSGLFATKFTRYQRGATESAPQLLPALILILIAVLAIGLALATL